MIEYDEWIREKDYLALTEADPKTLYHLIDDSLPALGNRRERRTYYMTAQRNGNNGTKTPERKNLYSMEFEDQVVYFRNMPIPELFRESMKIMQRVARAASSLVGVIGKGDHKSAENHSLSISKDLMAIAAVDIVLDEMEHARNTTIDVYTSETALDENK